MTLVALEYHSPGLEAREIGKSKSVHVFVITKRILTLASSRSPGSHAFCNPGLQKLEVT